MEKEELLKQLSDALANDSEIRIVKVKYENGEVFRFDYKELKVEVKNENEEEDNEEVVQAENEVDDDDDDADDDDDDDADDDDEIKNTSSSNNQGSTQTVQTNGRKVNVINR